jgi:hypothetical protein
LEFGIFELCKIFRSIAAGAREPKTESQKAKTARKTFTAKFGRNTKKKSNSWLLTKKLLERQDTSDERRILQFEPVAF